MLLFLNFIVTASKRSFFYWFFITKSNFKLLFIIFYWWFITKISLTIKFKNNIYFIITELIFYVINFFVKKSFSLLKKLNPFYISHIFLSNDVFSLKDFSLYGFILRRNKLLDFNLPNMFVFPVRNYYNDFNFFRFNRHLIWLLFFSKPQLRGKLWFRLKTLSPRVLLSKTLVVFGKMSLYSWFTFILILIVISLSVFAYSRSELEDLYVNCVSMFFLFLNDTLCNTFVFYLFYVSLSFLKNLLILFVFDFIDMAPFKFIFNLFFCVLQNVVFYFSLPNINYVYIDVDLKSNFSLRSLLLILPFFCFNFLKFFSILVFCFSMFKLIFYFVFGYVINLKTMPLINPSNILFISKFWVYLNKLDDFITIFENYLNVHLFFIWWRCFLFFEYYIKLPILCFIAVIKYFYYFSLRLPYLIIFAFLSLHFLVFVPLVVYWLLEMSIVNYIFSSISLFVFPGSSPWFINNILGTLHDLFPRLDYNFVYTYFDPFSYDSILEPLRYSDDDRRFIQDLFLNILAKDRLENDDEFYNSLSVSTNQQTMIGGGPLTSVYLNLLDQNEDVDSYHDLFEDYSSLELLFRLENCMNSVVEYLLVLDEKLQNRAIYTSSDETFGSINRRSEDVIISYSIFWRLKTFFRLFIVIIWLWQIKIFFLI